MKHLFRQDFEGFKVAVATPRSLPSSELLQGRVIILDLAFAHSKPIGRYPSVTHKLIDRLGDRLALFLDHHDSDFHDSFADDPRFILATKAQHGACPEMITRSMVERIGLVDTILCHGDFDGIASAAKWIRSGVEPYQGCDHDAWCVDTRLDRPSPIGLLMDRALRADHRDPIIKEKVLRFLLSGGEDQNLKSSLAEIGEETRFLEERAESIAVRYQVLSEKVAFVDVRDIKLTYDRTHLLLCGQGLAKIAVVLDESSVTFAAPFNSGLNFLNLFQVSGGMPTVLSLPPHRCRGALTLLGVTPQIAKSLSSGTEKSSERS